MLTENNIDVLIIDHHKIENDNPYATIVNPQLDNDKYPNKNICGSQVVFKVIQTLDKHYLTKYAEGFYDLIALGTIGDVMTLVEPENRFLVDTGMKNISNLGLIELFTLFKKDTNKLKTSDFSYSIAPAFNSCCRLNRLELAIQFLLEDDVERSTVLASEIIGLNETRKIMQQVYYNDLLPVIKMSVESNNMCLIAITQTVGKGYRGLIATNFAEEFQRTVFIVSEDKDSNYYSGSFRTYGDFNVREFLKDVTELVQIVGHDTVGGVKFLKNDLNEVVQYFNENIIKDQNEAELEYIMEINLSDLTESIIKDAEKFFHLSGKGIETGKFKITNLTVIDKKVMGKDKNTVKLSVVPTSDTYFLDEEDIKQLQPVANLMKFRTNEEFFPDDLIGKEIEVVGELNINEWLHPRTRKVIKTNQIFIEDFRLV